MPKKETLEKEFSTDNRELIVQNIIHGVINDVFTPGSMSE